jgi:hypothetical protein
MKHYDFAEKLRTLWDKACRLYTDGQRDAGTYFTADERTFLAANGLTAQHLYDYAEDFTSAGEPSWDTALAIELVRRDYFLNVQGGKPSQTVLDEARLPAKTEAESEGQAAWRAAHHPDVLLRRGSPVLQDPRHSSGRIPQPRLAPRTRRPGGRRLGGAAPSRGEVARLIFAPAV